MVSRLLRAQGCFLGQLSGDALGSLVELRSPESILSSYPVGIRDMRDGGSWNTIAGQPTDDSEMAITLARSLVEHKTFDQEEIRRSYIYWLESSPFDIGNTIYAGLSGRTNHQSQANGALMRVSPLGIFGSTKDLKLVAGWAKQDAAITHPHPICLQSNMLFTMSIAYAISEGANPSTLYTQVVRWANEIYCDEVLIQAIEDARTSAPLTYGPKKGWVLVALHNAYWQMLHARNFEEAIVDTVMRGGDTDTNAAICGALLGAVYGLDAIPLRWKNTVLNCRPDKIDPRVKRWRPQFFWPTDALDLAAQLLGSQA